MIGCGSRNRWSYGLSGASRARFGNSVCLQLFIAAFPAKPIKSTSCGDWRLRGIAYADPPAWKQVVTSCQGTPCLEPTVASDEGCSSQDLQVGQKDRELGAALGAGAGRATRAACRVSPPEQHPARALPRDVC